MTHTVVLFGDSITRGLVSANYIDLLAERLGGMGYRFVNAGVNNDHSYNLVLRTGSVIARQPETVIMLIGTNDVISSLSWLAASFNRARKSLPFLPTLRWYEENVTRIVRRLKDETGARVALASIPVLGEDLHSQPIQTVELFNSRLRDIAVREGTAYIPVFERQAAYLRSNGSLPPRTYTLSIPLMAELTARRAFLREDYDRFSQRKGFHLLTDGVHMNSQGAQLIAEAMEEYLRSTHVAV